MENYINPFNIARYTSKENFCNRENELKQLLRNVKNDINTTPISSRRLGKTGLLLRFFDELLTEKRIEVLRQTDIQQAQNVNFIFSGSRQHIMMELFNNSKRPFYNSTQFIQLNKIDSSKYSEFIQNMMTKHKRTITTEALDFIR
jgi:hypothetical protein